MAIEQYFIKEGYAANTQVVTREVDLGTQYWNKSRIRTSRHYQYAVYAYAKKIIQRTGCARVVDVGCGVGTKLAMLHDQLPDVEFVGIDQPGAIDFCRKMYGFGTWHVDDIEHPDESLKDIRADLLICADVIEHLYDANVLLRYLKDKLSAHGRVVLSTPERDLLRGKDCMHCPNAYHVREWNASELRGYLEHSGFNVIEHSLVHPVRWCFNRIFYDEIIKRALQGKSLRYTQVCLLSLR